MKKQSPILAVLAFVLAAVMLLSACTPATTNPADTSLDTTADTTTGDTTQGEVLGTTGEDATLGEDQPADTTAGDSSDTTGSGDTSNGAPTTTANGPVFNYQGGLYTKNLSIELSAPEGYTIRYTTDGSVPNSRSTKYSKPISFESKVGEALTVRAACFGSDKKISGAVATHTYVKVATAASTLYTVMISVEEDDLDDMLADVHAKVERPAHVEVVTPDGETVVSQDAGIRLFGGSSRTLDQKSFKLIARKTGYFGENQPYVGKGTFRYELFPDRVVKAGEDAGKVLDRYDAFILRNGGNDALIATACNPEYATLLRDGLANNFASKVTENLEYSLSQFAVVYLNGEYYGLLDMRENLNEDFVKRVWGVLDDDVVVIKSELDTSRSCGDWDESHDTHGCRYCGAWFFYETDDNQNAKTTLNEWIAFCKKIIGKINASDADYNAAYKEFEANVDIEGMIEWYALSLYLCNTDWPHNNVKLWKYTGQPIDGVAITDGKWRFMTRDMDMTMGRYDRPDLSSDLDSRPTVDSFYRTLGNYLDYSKYYDYSGEEKLYADPLYLQGIFAFCMRNDAFRDRFEKYCRELINTENKNLLDSIYDEMFAQIKPEMNDHIKRWKSHLESGYRLRTWTDACKSLTSFISNRPAKFEQYLERCLAMYE